MSNSVIRFRRVRRQLRPVDTPFNAATSLKDQIELRRIVLRDIGLLRTRLGNLLKKMLRNRVPAGPRSGRAHGGRGRFAADRIRNRAGASRNGRGRVI